MKWNKKGSIFTNLGGLAVGIATLCIVLVVTFLIIAEGQEQASDIEGIDFTVDNATSRASLTYNATQTMTEAVDDIPGWMPLIVIAVIGVILLSLVTMFRRR